MELRIIFLIAVSTVIRNVVCGRVLRVYNSDPAMKIVRAEVEEDLPRAALLEILQNSQHFQDIFAEQIAPFQIQFGHICESPSEWEQRFERQDRENNRFQGKVRWGKHNGNYGEHYWDFNH